MSITYHDIPEGEFVPQSDFRTQESPNGGVTATQSYILRASSLEALVDQGTWAKGKPLSQLDDSIGIQGDSLYLDRVATSKLPGGLLRVNAFFAGFSTTSSYGFDEGRTVVPTYSFRGELNEASILNHPDIVSNSTSFEDVALVRGCVDGIYKWHNATDTVRVIIINPRGEEVTKDTFNQPGILAQLYCQEATKGNVTFLSPKFVWEKNWEDDKGLDAADLAKVGQVDQAPDGDPPTLPGAREWLLTSASQVQSGELFRNRIEWTSSDDAGWGPLYN